MPLSIWLEKDIFDYIRQRNLDIADIYHKGAARTGCMFCGYGCQIKGDNRLNLVQSLYPKFYQLFMNYKNNGVTYQEALEKSASSKRITITKSTKLWMTKTMLILSSLK